MKILKKLVSVLLLTIAGNAYADLQIRHDQFAVDMIAFMKQKGYPVDATETRSTIGGRIGTDYSESVERRDAHLGDFRPIADTPYRYILWCAASRFVTDDGFYDDTFGYCVVGAGEGQFKGEWAEIVEKLSRQHNITGFTCSGSGANKSCTYRG